MLKVPMPAAARRRIILKGDVPSPSHPPSGLRFHTRCPDVFDRCRSEEPALRTISDGQLTGCHLDELQVVQNPMAGDAAVLPGEPAHSDANGADAARGLAMP